MCLEFIKTIKNKIAHKMSAFIQQISICLLFAQKSMVLRGYGWMGGWMGGNFEADLIIRVEPG